MAVRGACAAIIAAGDRLPKRPLVHESRSPVSHLATGCAKRVLSKARTRQSSLSGPTVNTTIYRAKQPSWSAVPSH